MNYEVNQRQSKFYNTRRARNRDFNFNNRNCNKRLYVCQTSRGHEYKEVPKPQRLFGESSAQSQGADSSFATGNSLKPFTSRSSNRKHYVSQKASDGHECKEVPKPQPFRLFGVSSAQSQGAETPSKLVITRYINRQKESDGHGCKEVPKPQPFRLFGVSSVQSQGADSSFATKTHSNSFTSRPQLLTDALSFKRVNASYHQPFTGHRFNLTVTIPTFSGVRSSVFRFQNSSAKAAPASMFQQSSSCHKGNKIGNPLKSDEIGINEDVQYLYTVQAKGGELVKVVDISEDSDHLSRSDESSRKILKIPEKETFKDAARGAGRKRKKSTEDLCCEICDKGYDFFRNGGEEIFRARCGHMFCQLCLKELNPYKCPECDIFLQKLLKVCF